MNWWQYVLQVTGSGAQIDIANRVKLSQASISRWKESAPKPENVVAFARAYNRPVLEAFVAAGFLTPEEAKERPVGQPSLDPFSTTELLAEVSRRTAEMEKTQLNLVPSEGGKIYRMATELKESIADDNLKLPPNYYELAAHPVTDSPSMREHAEGLERGEESQDHTDDEN